VLGIFKFNSYCFRSRGGRRPNNRGRGGGEGGGHRQVRSENDLDKEMDAYMGTPVSFTFDQRDLLVTIVSQFTYWDFLFFIFGLNQDDSAMTLD
jgi:hypothetical protein